MFFEKLKYQKNLALYVALLVILTIFIKYFDPIKGRFVKNYSKPEGAVTLMNSKSAGGLYIGKSTRKVNVSGGVETEVVVQFAKKVACQQNTAAVNGAVELWYAQHGGQYPKEDLSDIGRDRDYFPSGIPICPITGTRYTLDPESHRITGHSHSDVTDIKLPSEEKKKPVGKPPASGAAAGPETPSAQPVER